MCVCFNPDAMSCTQCMRSKRLASQTSETFDPQYCASRCVHCRRKHRRMRQPQFLRAMCHRHSTAQHVVFICLHRSRTTRSAAPMLLRVRECHVCSTMMTAPVLRRAAIKDLQCCCIPRDQSPPAQLTVSGCIFPVSDLQIDAPV